MLHYFQVCNLRTPFCTLGCVHKCLCAPFACLLFLLATCGGEGVVGGGGLAGGGAGRVEGYRETAAGSHALWVGSPVRELGPGDKLQVPSQLLQDPSELALFLELAEGLSKEQRPPAEWKESLRRALKPAITRGRSSSLLRTSPEGEDTERICDEQMRDSGELGFVSTA